MCARVQCNGLIAEKDTDACKAGHFFQDSKVFLQQRSGRNSSGVSFIKKQYITQTYTTTITTTTTVLRPFTDTVAKKLI